MRACTCMCTARCAPARACALLADGGGCQHDFCGWLVLQRVRRTAATFELLSLCTPGTSDSRRRTVFGPSPPPVLFPPPAPIAAPRRCVAPRFTAPITRDHEASSAQTSSVGGAAELVSLQRGKHKPDAGKGRQCEQQDEDLPLSTQPQDGLSSARRHEVPLSARHALVNLWRRRLPVLLSPSACQLWAESTSRIPPIRNGPALLVPAPETCEHLQSFPEGRVGRPAIAVCQL